jgi:hypothetical protein
MFPFAPAVKPDGLAATVLPMFGAVVTLHGAVAAELPVKAVGVPGPALVPTANQNE